MNIKFRVVIFFALILLAIAPELQAQTFTTIYSFSATNYDAALGYASVPGSPPVGMTNSDGASPFGALILSGNTLYGTASGGGSYALGTLFAMNTDGTGFTNLYNFTDGTDSPDSALVLSGPNLYGTTPGDGYGIAFLINTNGTGFTSIHVFTGVTYGYRADGAEPSGLALCGNCLYGMSEGLGGSGGLLFAINTNGPTFSAVVNFTSSQGFNCSALISSGTNLYGAAMDGGPDGNGAIFKVNTNGSAPTVLHGFARGTSFSPHIINSDGATPVGALVLYDNTLYGTTSSGGNTGNGSVFAVNTNGLGFTNLYFFSATNSSDQNNDGTHPQSSLVLSGDMLYGTTPQGGVAGCGTVFAICTNGTGFTILHTFTGTNDGANPYTGLVLSGSTLYGTTAFGGTNGNGTLFSITLPPPPPNIVALNFFGTNLVINATGSGAGTYATLMSTNPLLPISQWTPVATNILTASGNFTITNAVDPKAAQCFYVLQAH